MNIELTIRSLQDIDVTKLDKEQLLVHIKRLECLIGHLKTDKK